MNKKRADWNLSEAVDYANRCGRAGTKHMSNEKVDATALHVTALTDSNSTECSNQCHSGCQQNNQHGQAQTGITLSYNQ